ncbi:peptide chain release factor 2 [Coxiella endosymbiont of Ornithodoros amblus]|uniref:peptide chain release factor 2 n=1 Tax=Coxiella endosymbiont of Ornithodoros amblus TaxID=1656166 RepID=UPI00244E268E|nr:peptide chain release factor 2 [Coxiella endosymbiont of Ornithodoros amblus]MBW5802675.1 peptide chain release factor 2 [Coxiella endosymbiont of Ornithodoros amblus]
MLEINLLIEKLNELKARSDVLRRYLDLSTKETRLLEIQRELENPAVWQDPEKAQSLSRERSELEALIQQSDIIDQRISDAIEMAQLSKQEKEADLITDLNKDFKQLEKTIAEMEFQRMFSGEMDSNNAYLDIQAGSGGTEAQDWAEMLLRMYLRWGNKHGFTTTLMEASPGEVAGIKSATIEFTGSYAYGWLRSETGVHRLVRKSPFDSSNRRHTSFASVFVSPEIDDDIEIEINPEELRIDTYRARGAGGQHVNRTDSAVRITHLPSRIVVQCQNDRSQHKNKAQAMKQLRAKLYEIEMMKQQEKQALLEASKSEISWGNQIRSYVLDASRIKDLRTGVETSNAQAVLDGDINLFIEACLKQEDFNDTAR